MQVKPVIGLYLDIRYPYAQKKYKVKLRVTYKVFKDGKATYPQKYYDLPKDFFFTSDEWNKLNAKDIRGSLRKQSEELEGYKKMARDLVDQNPFVTHTLFAALWGKDFVMATDLKMMFKHEEDKARTISTAETFANAYKSLVDFGGEELTLQSINVQVLKDYEAWMIKKGRSYSTIGIYLRNLRKVYKKAIKDGQVPASLYPFGQDLYEIPTGIGTKKALAMKDKETLNNYNPDNHVFIPVLPDTVPKKKYKATYYGEIGKYNKFGRPGKEKAISQFMFSYYAKGMNFIDMAYLKPEQIQSDVLVFYRKKTINTVKIKRPIVHPLNDVMKAVLAKYGNHKPYCFGVINDQMDEATKKKKIKQWTKTTNKWLNRVASDLGIQGKITTYTARHTAATILLKAGANLKYIQDSLGHAKLSTTEFYLKGLDIDESREFTNMM